MWACVRRQVWRSPGVSACRELWEDDVWIMGYTSITPWGGLSLSQWETSLQRNAVSHWLGENLESALHVHSHPASLHTTGTWLVSKIGWMSVPETAVLPHWPILDSKDPRIDIDYISIRHFRVGLMSNRCQSDDLCYLGCEWHQWALKSYMKPLKVRETWKKTYLTLCSALWLLMAKHR